MKRGLLYFLIFLLAITSILAADPIYEYESLILEQTISNDVVIVPTRSNYQIQYFNISLFLFPENSYRQRIKDLDLTPVPDNNKLFTWNNPQTRLLQLDTSFTLETSSNPVLIKEKVPFPLKLVPLSVTEYVKPTASIDVNNEMKQLAGELAQDVDDLFILQHRLARWVNQNIEYNLSSITADANYPASWVLDTGYGVCDELTNLFIALNRALGIPARFVSGIAYSDSILFENKWGNHGWAEVYFPGYGWIPYDVTYQQYGYLDATHIEMQKGVDGTAPSIEYRTKGLYYDFEPTTLDFQTKVVSYGKKNSPKTTMSLDIQEESVNFGSYNLITVTVTNLQDYYVVEDVTLARASELTYLDPLRQSIALKPYETKKIHWLLKVDPDLDQNYIYTFPIEIFGTHNNKAEGAFSVVNRAETFGREYMDQYIEEETSTSSEASLNCQYKETYLLNETVMLSCTSPDVLDEICYQDYCIYITQDAEFSFIANSVGINTAIVTTKKNDEEKKHFFTYEVSDQASLEIAYVNITQNVAFEDFATLSVKISKNSSAHPRNVTMILEHEMLEKEWFFSFLDKDKSFDIDLPAQGFILGKNTFTIIVTYYDSEGKLQSTQASTTTSHAPLKRSQQLLVYYNTYAAKIIDYVERFGVGRYYAELIAPGVIMIGVFILISLFKQVVYFLMRRIPPVKK